MGGCTRVRKEKRAARRRRGSVVRKGFDERKDCLRKRHPARRRLAERRFRFDRVVVRARVFVGGFPERRPALGRLARRAGSRRGRLARRTTPHPVSGSRERSGTSGSGTSGSGTPERGLRARPRARRVPKERVGGERQRTALATSAARGRDDGSVASACFTSDGPRFLAGSRDHFRRPREAPAQRGELSVRAEGGRSSRSWNSRHPSAQTSAGRPTPRAAKTGWRTSHISGAR